MSIRVEHWVEQKLTPDRFRRMLRAFEQHGLTFEEFNLADGEQESFVGGPFLAREDLIGHLEEAKIIDMMGAEAKLAGHAIIVLKASQPCGFRYDSACREAAGSWILQYGLFAPKEEDFRNVHRLVLQLHETLEARETVCYPDLVLTVGSRSEHVAELLESDSPALMPDNFVAIAKPARYGGQAAMLEKIAAHRQDWPRERDREEWAGLPFPLAIRELGQDAGVWLELCPLRNEQPDFDALSREGRFGAVDQVWPSLMQTFSLMGKGLWNFLTSGSGQREDPDKDLPAWMYLAAFALLVVLIWWLN